MNVAPIDWTLFEWPPSWIQLLEIGIIAVGIYFLLSFLRGTRAAQVLLGFFLMIFLFFVLTQILNLDTLSWILQQFTPYLFMAFLIIFHPEIRRGLAGLGRKKMFAGQVVEKEIVDALVSAVDHLSERKIGALVAIEREIKTKAYQEHGTRIDSAVNPELLASLFFPRSPLHDGAVIIRNGRIAAAGCVFPLSQKESLSKSLGTRHRAAIGISEETDAVIIVVSEETGSVSLAYKEKLIRGLDSARLRRLLTSLLNRKSKEKSKKSSSFQKLFNQMLEEE